MLRDKVHDKYSHLLQMTAVKTNKQKNLEPINKSFVTDVSTVSISGFYFCSFTVNGKLKMHIWCIKKNSSEHQINIADLVNYDFYYFEISNVNANQSCFKVMMKALGKCIIHLCSHLVEFILCAFFVQMSLATRM